MGDRQEVRRAMNQPPNQPPQGNNPQPGPYQPPSYTNPQSYMNAGWYQPPPNNNPQAQMYPNGQANHSIARPVSVATTFIFVSILLYWFFTFVYPNFRAGSTSTLTPITTAADTLNTFCNALQSHDYQTAYAQLSSSDHQFASEAEFASIMDSADKSLGGLTSCTAFGINENNQSGVANGTLSLTYGNGTDNFYNARLANEGGTWKITQINN